MRAQIQQNCIDFVQAVLENLPARFPQSKLLEATKVFDPLLLPHGEELGNYGEEEIDTLSIQYSTFIDKNECQLEWDTLKQCIAANFKKSKYTEFLSKLASLEEFRVQYPSLSVLAEIILTYPASTSEVERGFSFQNAIKTKVCNRLGSEHLDQLLRLCLNAPQQDKYPFHEAYLQWLDDKKCQSTSTII